MFHKEKVYPPDFAEASKTAALSGISDKIKDQYTAAVEIIGEEGLDLSCRHVVPDVIDKQGRHWTGYDHSIPRPPAPEFRRVGDDIDEDTSVGVAFRKALALEGRSSEIAPKANEEYDLTTWQGRRARDRRFAETAQLTGAGFCGLTGYSVSRHMSLIFNEHEEQEKQAEKEYLIHQAAVEASRFRLESLEAIPVDELEADDLQFLISTDHDKNAGLDGLDHLVQWSASTALNRVIGNLCLQSRIENKITLAHNADVSARVARAKVKAAAVKKAKEEKRKKHPTIEDGEVGIELDDGGNDAQEWLEPIWEMEASARLNFEDPQAIEYLQFEQTFIEQRAEDFTETLSCLDQLHKSWMVTVARKIEKMVKENELDKLKKWIKGTAEALAEVNRTGLRLNDSDEWIRGTAKQAAKECTEIVAAAMVDSDLLKTALSIQEDLLNKTKKRPGDIYRAEAARNAYLIKKARENVDAFVMKKLGLMTPPEGPKQTNNDGIIVGKASDPKWWRRKLRVHHGRAVEYVARHLMLHGQGLKSITNETLRAVRDQDIGNEEALEKMFMTDGTNVRSLKEIRDFSPASPKARQAEYFERARGMARFALTIMGKSSVSGWSAYAGVVTCPSRFHPRSTFSDKKNPKWDGSSSREGQDHLQKGWEKFRSLCQKAGIPVFGYRTTESHGNATPHWNLLLFLPRNRAADVKALLRRTFLLEQNRNEISEDSNEDGAKYHRVKFHKLVPHKGASLEDIVAATVGYFSKYIFKNVARNKIEIVEKRVFNEQTGKYETQVTEHLAAGRDEAWARKHVIRQFQFFGTEAVGLYRSVRSITKKRMLDKDFRDSLPPVFIEAWAAAMGVPMIEKRSMRGVVTRELQIGHDGVFAQGKPNYCRFLELTEHRHDTGAKQVFLQVFNQKKQREWEDDYVEDVLGLELKQEDPETGFNEPWREKFCLLHFGQYDTHTDPGRYGDPKPGKPLYIKIFELPANQAGKTILTQRIENVEERFNVDGQSTRVALMKADRTECNNDGSELSKQDKEARSPALNAQGLRDLINKGLEIKLDFKSANLVHLFKDKTKTETGFAGKQQPQPNHLDQNFGFLARSHDSGQGSSPNILH